MDDNSQPWDRMRDENGKLEPGRWFSRFEIFRHLGPERTLEETFRRWRENAAINSKTKRPNPSWYKAAEKWHWKARAEAWDLHVARVANQEMEEEHTRRQKVMIEWEWDAFRQLKDRIDQMLRYPLAKVTRSPDEEGGVTTVTPVGWRMRDIVAFAKVASELGRLSVGMATAHSELDVNLAAKEFLDALPPATRKSVRQYLVEALQRGGAEGGS